MAMAFPTRLPCLVCQTTADWIETQTLQSRVNCGRCGIYDISRRDTDDWRSASEFATNNAVALLSNALRELQGKVSPPLLTIEFAKKILREREPSYPAEVCDKLVRHLGGKLRGTISTFTSEPVLTLVAKLGLARADDLWEIVQHLTSQGLVEHEGQDPDVYELRLTILGWSRFQSLLRSAEASHFAFFGRKFDNPELDRVFERCLRPAVLATGYELRTVTQSVGLIDSVIENEIRNCRFLVADLSDANDGAYWEAGFAEGLGKPVFYVCKNGVKTHFDTNHRFTVFWDLANLDAAAKDLTSRIRNALLGDAIQTDP